jgi:V-type H+-transporting ATPase subunit a
MSGSSYLHSFVAGVIPRARVAVFERILFRSLRGNLLMNHSEITDPVKDPKTDLPVYKNVFIVFAHGKELIAKITKICNSMGATIYPVDDNSAKREEDSKQVLSRLEDLNHVLVNTKAARVNELERVNGLLEEWTLNIQKEKAIYHTMNLFNYDVNRKALIAEGWCPTNSLQIIQNSLRAVTVHPSNSRNAHHRL